jgi:hypothetical protein
MVEIGIAPPGPGGLVFFYIFIDFFREKQYK